MMVAVLLTAGLTVGCAPEAGGTINIAGSTSVQPVSEKLAKAYMERHPEVTINVAGGGSSVGVKSVADGTADIGNCSRELKASEKEKWPELIPHVIARDAIVVVVHPTNKVANLTTEQIRGIYAGEITDWAQVGGDPGAIAVISREEGSGTRKVFEKLIMGDKKITLGAIFHISAGMVRTAVAEMPLGIGYISYPYLDPSTKAVAIDGVAPTLENLKAGNFPLVRPLFKLTKGEPAGLVKDFLDFCLSPEGQKIVEDEGFIPVR
ncbi:MAG TPA: phosphate ABC transporter substrate-binding protein [Dehalococcoidia bacterium]|nr:phosphate ABC transporter substrate-binding protein [Dehalococcoidia bacterium]